MDDASPAVATRIAPRLAAIFVAGAALVVVVAQADTLRPALLSVEGVVLAIALALAGAWCLLQPLAAQLSAQLAGQAAAIERSELQRRELLVNLSHDLRTPLAAMQGYLELLLLRSDALDAVEARNYLQTAARHSERLGRLVGDLFELARLEGGETQPQAEPFALAELAHDVAQKFAAAAAQRQVTLSARCEASTAAAMVSADVALVERVLAALVDNALRHTPAGGTVTIATAAGGRNGALVSVRDSGEGIAAADLAGIFERYERAERVGAASGNVGLGLAIAQRIVKLHGSQLTVRSTPGLGTEVSFELALAAHPPARTPSPCP